MVMRHEQNQEMESVQKSYLGVIGHSRMNTLDRGGVGSNGIAGLTIESKISVGIFGRSPEGGKVDFIPNLDSLEALILIPLS